MPDDSAVITEISRCAYQALVNIEKQHPAWLKSGYRYILWSDPQYQSAFMAGLSKKLEATADTDALMSKLREYLGLFLEQSFFECSEFGELEAKVRQILSHPDRFIESNELSSSETITPPVPERVATPDAIAILLLDAENLQLDRATEEFLKLEVCTYPIQVKIAFANWKSRGKQDIELHERGYDLIHVPVGRDHADGKMLMVGSSIREHYPQAKEVLVCSSDTVMTNLCNQLQKSGLTVYRVRRHKDTVTVSNSQTGETKTCTLTPQIPPPEEFLKQLKALILTEQRSASFPDCVLLSRIAQVYQKKYQIPLKQVLSAHNLGDKDEDIFINQPAHFVVYQRLGESELYVNAVELSSNYPIESQSDLEQALVSILTKLISQTNEKYIFISTLANKFRQDYREPIKETLERLGWEGNLSQFLQKCRSFVLDKTGKQVTLAQS